jgi:hypothetical protein
MFVSVLTDDGSNVIATRVVILGFIGWVEGPTFEIGVLKKCILGAQF